MLRRLVMPGRSGSKVTRRNESVVARPIFFLIVLGSSRRLIRELSLGSLLLILFIGSSREKMRAPTPRIFASGIIKTSCFYRLFKRLAKATVCPIFLG